jgi:hypothetical protein
MCSYTLETGFFIEIAMMKMMFSDKALRMNGGQKERPSKCTACISHGRGVFKFIVKKSESLMRSYLHFLASV